MKGVVVLAVLGALVTGQAEAGPRAWVVVGELPRDGDEEAVLAVAGPEDVWAVSGEVLRHWRGGGWDEVVPAGTEPGTRFARVIASGPDDVWVFTTLDTTYMRDRAVHWDGRRWTWAPEAAMVLPAFGRTDANLALAGGELWRVSQWEPGVARLRAGRWRFTRAPLSARSLGGTDADHLWAVGEDDQGLSRPAVARWNGEKWRNVPLPALPGVRLADVEVVSRAGVWVVGARRTGHERYRPVALHWNGRSWQRIPTGTLGEGEFGDVVSDGQGGVWASLGDRVAHYAHGRWTITRPKAEVHDLARVPNGTDLWAVSGNRVLRYAR